jgi:hypothetical protein
MIGKCFYLTGSRRMNKLTPEEEQQIINGPPRGTFALLLAYGALILLMWLLFYFARYMALGPAS